MQETKYSLEQIIYGCLVLLVFTLPLTPVGGSILFAVTMLLALYDRVANGPRTTNATMPYKLKVLLCGLFILSGLSVFLSGNVFASAFNWCYVVLEEAGCFWLVWRYAQKRHRALLLMKVFLASAFLVACYGLGQYHFGWGLQDSEWTDAAAFPELRRRAYSTLGNPNILGSFLVMTMAYCAGIFAPLEGGKTRLCLGIVFLTSLLCELVTFSRGNWIALFWVLLVFAAFFYRKAFLPLISGGLVVLYVFWNMLAARILSIFSTTQDTSAALRLAYLESSIVMLEEHPFGVGWYGYQFAFPNYDFYLKDPSVIMYHCHNLFLNVGTELGVLGLVLFVCALWGLFKVACRLRRIAPERWYRGIACGYIASLVGVLVGGLTDHTLFNIQLGMLFWMWNALVLVLYAQAKASFKQGL